MKILFCKISCMKYYKGACDKDIPYNGGSFVDENGYGHEENNFNAVQDENGDFYPDFGVENDDEGYYKKYRTSNTEYDAEYVLSPEEIKQITGIPKSTFYEYQDHLSKKFAELQMFDYCQKAEELRVLVYDWAQNNDICKAMDEAVAQKNVKKIKTHPEITGTCCS